MSATALRSWRAPLLVYLLCSAVYVVTSGERALQPSPNDHFVHLADSFLHGQLSVVGDRPPGTNDWALYQGRWYVSFPPFPAVVILPAVAIWGTQLPGPLFWALLAGLAPALLYVLLRHLRHTGRSGRGPREDFALTVLFAFGSVYFSTAVQGSVWFAAHVVACPLLVLYVMFSLDARRPWWAGAMLGLAFMARPSTAFAFPFFAIEALGASRRADAAPLDAELYWLRRVAQWLAAVQWRKAVRHMARFAVPVLVVGVVAMWMNQTRFDDPFEFGHRYLQIRWRPRIEKWGLFNYHYLGRNLAVALASLPWLTAQPPHLRISRHGLAAWVTTPHLLWVLWPKRVSATMVALYVASACVALVDLLYQNTGWVQFGYRFSLDYMAMLLALLALGGRRFGPGFYALMVFAFAINLFGAITFDRMPQFYDTDMTQRVLFQPD